MASKETYGRKGIAAAEVVGGGGFLFAAIGSLVGGGFSVAVALEALAGALLLRDGTNRWKKND